jgi:DNA-binding HxlR family transcriptional regulator
MALLDLLGHRWVLRIVWELQGKELGFRALQRQCDAMSPTVLSQRLGELQEAGIVQQNEDGAYLLTQEGETLLHALAPLNDWALRWAERELLAQEEEEGAEFLSQRGLLSKNADDVSGQINNGQGSV